MDWEVWLFDAEDLIGDSAVSEAVANDNLATLKCGKDDSLNVLSSVREK